MMSGLGKGAPTFDNNDADFDLRGDQFELKNPAGLGGDNTDGMTEYEEVEGEEEVMREVAKFTKVDLDAMVELVKVVAVRESWSLGKFSIVIDKIKDDNWSVGEVELLVGNKDEVEMAKKKVQDMASKLGFTIQRCGKVEHCLRYSKNATESWRTA